jgi:hypothetical protein
MVYWWMLVHSQNWVPNWVPKWVLDFYLKPELEVLQGKKRRKKELPNTGI